MNQIFNVQPLFFFNADNFLNGDLSQQTVAFQNLAAADQNYDKQSEGDGEDKNDDPVNVRMPQWFPKYFETSLSALVQVPYRVPRVDLSQVSTNRTLAQAFAADSMANPNDAFDLRQRRNQLTADDGKRAIQIIRDSMASAAKESDIVGEYSDPDKMRNYILMGKPMPKDGIMEPVKQPPELAVTVGRFRNKLAEVMPWVDMRQALWAFDVVNGRGEGDDNMDVNAAYSKNPLLPAVAAANATLSADSSRKQLMMNYLSRQIHYQQAKPTAPVRNFDQMDTVKRIADRHKFMRTHALQIRRNAVSRFAYG